MADRKIAGSEMAGSEDVVFIYSTLATPEDADRVAVHLVGQGLAACGNVLPGMRSTYMWQGEIKHDSEVVLILKTRSSLQEAAIAAVREVHPYDIPAITAFTASGADADFADWVGAVTARGAGHA